MPVVRPATLEIDAGAACELTERCGHCTDTFRDTAVAAPYRALTYSQEAISYLGLTEVLGAHADTETERGRERARDPLSSHRCDVTDVVTHPLTHTDTQTAREYGAPFVK